MNCDGVLVVAFGGPHRSEDVMPFLRQVVAGRGVSDARLARVAEHYELMGGRSPITDLTRAQAAAIKRELEARDLRVPIEVGMRNWNPWLRDALRDLVARGAKRVLAVIMAAQQTEASRGAYLSALHAALAELDEDAPQLEVAPSWHDADGLLEANLDRVSEGLSRQGCGQPGQHRVFFTAHSVPLRMAEGSPYVEQLRTLAAEIARRAGIGDWQLVYQSRSGSPRDPWLAPDISDALRAAHQEGVRHVLVAPIGFVCDHVEVLYDLDHEARATAEQLDMTFLRVATVGTHPAFITAIVDRLQPNLCPT